jgi:hypothetical protein
LHKQIGNMRVKEIIENHDHINHIELRSDIENGNIVGQYLTFEGKTLSNPEIWTISIDGSGIDYHYDSKKEYEEDVKILIQ